MGKCRRSIRLKGFDYSRTGYYFVTICTKERECLLGEVVDSTILLNEMGTFVEETWGGLPTRFPSVLIDQCVIMPNHLHGIINLKEQNNCGNSEPHMGLITGRGLINQTPTSDQIPSDWIMMKNPAMTLGKIVRYFKAKSALKIRNKMNISFYWQRNYYEHIIHEENELSRIRKYIILNPANWLMDEDNPANGKTS